MGLRLAWNRQQDFCSRTDSYGPAETGEAVAVLKSSFSSQHSHSNSQPSKAPVQGDLMPSHFQFPQVPACGAYTYMQPTLIHKINL